ncbi:DUF92 domain-containing protein [Paenibacillus sp. GCM10012307]|uniref:DUF92 domain-containing protein n=1 Tax=Paenibacillus roseus TaxID=2798579 RepID=A0A934J3V9_9BACL|nr:DUF92 domain-containing protein [Paenibacillus roseus]MBJ6359827.1 DUF92 domain-containing protein [Paenibacillus roseus]
MIAEWFTYAWFRLVAGLAGSLAISWLAYRRSSLSASGAWAAATMGTAYFVLGGPVWFGTLIAFFISSTLWSKWKRNSRAKHVAETNYAKGSQRDGMQVWANGGLGLILCAAHAWHPDPIWLFAFTGVMASVNADTWATEIGALSRRQPRALLSGRVVPAGTSGGVTLLGSLAAGGGAAFIGLCAALLSQAGPISSPGAEVQTQLAPAAVALLVVAAALSGLAGAFVDSLIGATGQVMYRCPACGRETERRTHCDVQTVRTRGWSWMNNDAVNFVSSAFAGGMAALLSLLII